MNPFNVFKYVPLSVMRAMALFVVAVAKYIPNLTIKEITMVNLRLVYPELSDKQRRKFKSTILRNQALSTVESIKCWAMPPEWSIEQIDNVFDREILEEALANPNGMLAIVPHLGTWEMMNAWLNQFGSPTILYKPVKGKVGNDFVLQGRQRLNATLVPTDASGVKALFKTLKSGGFSIILPDHVPQPSGGVTVPFFGIETLSSTLAPKLASKTKCALVGLTCLRNKNNRFDIYCTKLDNPELYSKDLMVSTKALNQVMENMIKVNPEHYMWSYKRFKRIPIIKNPYKATEEQLQSYINNYILPKENHWKQ
jgi:Kdo2-lipid IVA lauroyltransferase/acyltransferase